MLRLNEDPRIVMTLDAGGTNLKFSAIQGNKLLLEPIYFPPRPKTSSTAWRTSWPGFDAVREQCPRPPVAISFAFPGPADYPAGIIGDLPNLPAFRGGVALGPMLEEKFGMPVFINNDGDLFVYGEAIAGFLPQVNELLEKAGSPKRYQNLFGVTLGTGFGGGIVRDGQLFLGDNSVGGEAWLLAQQARSGAERRGRGLHPRRPPRLCAAWRESPRTTRPEPKVIYDIGSGQAPGCRDGGGGGLPQPGRSGRRRHRPGPHAHRRPGGHRRRHFRRARAVLAGAGRRRQRRVRQRGRRPLAPR